MLCFYKTTSAQARLAQSAERKALNLVVVSSSPTVGAIRRADRLLRGFDCTVKFCSAAACGVAVGSLSVFAGLLGALGVEGGMCTSGEHDSK